jgi:lysozyme
VKTSQAGINLIKQFEGCRLEAYQDIVGVWTIGYGSTKDVYPGLVITQEEAEDTLVERLADEFEPGVMSAIGNAPTTQNQFDAMISLAWNIGVGAFKRSSLARCHKAGYYDAAANMFKAYSHAGGKFVPALQIRRAAEEALYRAPDGSVTASVADVQRRLVELGHHIAVDGIAGPHTCRAILRELAV